MTVPGLFRLLDVGLARRQLLQTRLIPVELVSIPAVGVLVRILPDGLARPAARDGAGATGVAGQDQRIGADEVLGVARARRPPRRVRVKHRVPASLGVVGVAEVTDPGDLYRT